MRASRGLAVTHRVSRRSRARRSTRWALLLCAVVAAAAASAAFLASPLGQRPSVAGAAGAAREYASGALRATVVLVSR